MLLKNYKSNFYEPGFTLVETIVGISLFVVLALGVFALISFLLTVSKQQGGALSDSDQARQVAFNLINELRNASVSSVGGYPLATAENQQLVFFSNIDSSSDIERLRYYVSGGSLYKGVLKPSGSPLGYNPVNETTRVIQANLANGANPVFYYYDGTYVGATDNYLSQPVSLMAVKYIKIKLQVFNKAGKSNTNYFTVNAGGAIRTLKTNLGN